ncbi:MAG TPA: PAS domain S-box protein [Spirochaetota bacterium]|nr:PAS domain S-box protein [Spirochaetota bacterium]HRZ28466.1 PAS domain S-box protein [Spirochaetota bacterium]HSA15188.1 PAS domain S-box protein [Spirochaetota bacterium]
MNEQTQTILLVEDEAIIAMAEASILKREGYNVIQAFSGDDAVTVALNGHKIDLILMDIDLREGMDGTETAKAILEHRDIPIIFLSSHMEPEIVEKTDRITSYGYVVKNSGPTVLFASIKMAFRLHATRLELLEREKRLAESEARFRSIYEQAQHLVGVLDMHGTLIDMNSMAKDFIKGEENAIGKPFWEGAWWTHSSALIEKLKDAISRAKMGESSRFNADHIDYRGQIHYIDFILKPVNDEKGKPFCLIAEGRDITELVLTEKSLRKTEEEYRRILDTMQAVYYRADLVGKVVTVSSSIKDIMGYEPDEIIGKDISEEIYYNPQDRRVFLNAMETGGGRVNNYQVVLKRKDGTPITMLTSSHYILDPTGKRIGLEGIISIT